MIVKPTNTAGAMPAGTIPDSWKVEANQPTFQPKKLKERDAPTNDAQADARRSAEDYAERKKFKEKKIMQNQIEIELTARKILTLNLKQRREFFAELSNNELSTVALLLSAMIDQSRQMMQNTAKMTRPLSVRTVWQNLCRVF